MNLRPRILLALLVLAPILAIGALALKVTRDDRDAAEHRYRSLAEARVADVRDQARRVFAAIEGDLDRKLEAGQGNLRALERSGPLVRNAFALDAKGTLTHPDPAGALSAADAEFLERTRAIWDGRAVLYEAPRPEARAPVGRRGDRLVDLAARSEAGWVAWHWREGLHLLRWRRAGAGSGVVGAEVERVALVSQLVAGLPTSGPSDARFALLDGRGDRVHQWGDSNSEGEAFAEAALGYPLDGWKIAYYAADPDLYAASSHLGTALSVLAIAFVLAGAGLWLYREQQRELREAAQRVDFVTRVSHELKTPLTNIRLYAELLDDELDPDDDPSAVERVGVIRDESRRLTRLIHDVLAFSKRDRGELDLRRERVELHRLVAEVLEPFGPSFEARGIRSEVQCDEGLAAAADRDAVAQIFGNLLSNVEKYAAAGGAVSVVAVGEENTVRLRVADEGPGIPAGLGERIFEPFVRGSDSLHEGTSGTGIGLAIARDLARHQGGDLAVVASERGACFELRLPRWPEADREAEA